MADKIIVIGIDGGTLDLALPWISEGKLPHIGKLVENGTYGDLETVIPPLTGPAWVSFMTGTNPGKHGVFDFMRPGLDSVNLVDYHSIKVATLWDILSRHDRELVVVHHPVTYPPPEINGYLISGLLSGSGTLSHPPGLIDEVESHLGEKFRTHMSIGPQAGREALYIREFSKWHELLEKTSLFMLKKPWDLFMTVFNVTDGLSHALWRYMENGEEHGEGILHAYSIVDTSIGRILQEGPDDIHVILMSDHGFGPLKKNVNLNIYLMNKGYLKFRKKSYLKKLLFMMGFTPNNLMGLARKTRISQRRRSIPVQMRYRILDTFLSFKDVDWDETVAYSRGHVGQIYVNRPAVERKGLEYYQFRDQLIGDLYDLREDESNDRIVDRVYTQEEIYWGEHANSAPDLFVVMKDFSYLAYPLLTSDNRIVTEYKVEMRSGTHRMNGMFVGCGHRFDAGVRVEKAKIFDVAPTILDILDVPIPEHMDGRSLVSK